MRLFLSSNPGLMDPFYYRLNEFTEDGLSSDQNFITRSVLDVYLWSPAVEISLHKISPNDNRSSLCNSHLERCHIVIYVKEWISD